MSGGARGGRAWCWAVVLAWSALLIVSAPLAAELPGRVGDHGLSPPAGGDYDTVRHMLETQYGMPAEPVLVLLRKHGRLDEAAYAAYLREAVAALESVPGVIRVISPLERPEQRRGDYAYAAVELSPPQRAHPAVLDELRRRLPPHPDVEPAWSGAPVVQAEVNAASRRDVAVAERIGLPAALAVMWLALGGLLPALLPILVGWATVSAALAAAAWIAQDAMLSNFVLSVIPMVGLALSIDFALLLVGRYREELLRATPVAALQTTLRTAGCSVCCSALCAGGGLAAMMLIPVPMFASVAGAALLVLATSVVTCFTLLPALLVLLAPRLARAAGPRRSGGGRRLLARWLTRWTDAVMRRPVRSALLSGGVLLALLLPLLRIEVEMPDAGSLPAGHPVRAATQTMEEVFGPSGARVPLIAFAPGGAWTAADWARARRLALALSQDADVAGVDSPFALATGLGTATLETAAPQARLATYLRGGSMRIEVQLRHGAHAPEARAWVSSWARIGTASSLPVLVGGEVKREQELFDAVRAGAWHVLLAGAAANVVVLLLAFGSPALAAKTLLTSLLGMGAAFGVLTLALRYGAFGMERGPVALMIPAFVFGIVFAVSMDYGVFLVSRMCERYRASGDNDGAVREGMLATGPIITAAAAIMIAVTTPFALAEVAGVRQLGIGIAVAIFLDATLIRLMLVPALMRLLGRWNWGKGRFG
ncbi:MMPL family transporter [Paenibacillus sp. IB182496]|uniref:MMPL family transporter n=1 Tax=Paenibacillus sabuli TaxID=2772509 RepID=A0A927GU26_9BACL|nr:MMPL family transporter [Paenibacillus sabuli]MBD2847710.1 MMPL family transporter [Paenibacillus sabuli]